MAGHALDSPSWFSVHRRGLWWAGACAAVLAAVSAALVFFPWDLMRGPLNRYVSERTGRHFEITRHLDVRLGRTLRVSLDGVEFANPDWARDPYLIQAEGAEIDVSLWPLLRGRLDLPRVSLRQPRLALQLEPDGRRSWALGQDTSDTSTVPQVGSLLVDRGSLHFLASGHGADIVAEFAIDASASSSLPLSYRARGTWARQPFAAQGRTGSVLQLSAPLQQPFPAQVSLTAGRTRLKASGTVASLVSLDGADASFDLQGQSLADLYKLIGVVLPETPPYALRGRLSKQAKAWTVAGIQGRLGRSDLSGSLVYDYAHPVPLLSGKLQSKELDFNDLGPLVGVPADRTGTATATVAAGSSSSQRAAAPAPAPDRTAASRQRKLLPTATLDLERLKAMNADVWYSAADVQHVKALPLDRMNVHVKLDGGVLQLDPLTLGIAGGSLAGQLRIDANANPAAVSTRLEARLLQLNQLLPAVALTRSSLGKLNGRVDLQARGNSAAQMLASSNGNVALLMGQGEISNILLEFLGLDGGEIIKFLVRGDRNVRLRCAATAFDVKQGLMSSRTLVLDTDDTVINGHGQINLAQETLDIVLDPLPKDRSILSLRSPLKIGGTFAAPSAGPDKLALAGRAGLVLALGAINPLLALAATVETGPGKDEDCRRVLALASAPAAPRSR